MATASNLKLVISPDDARAVGWAAVLGAERTESERMVIERLLAWIGLRGTGRALPSGEPLLSHAVDATSILHDFRPDIECLAASLLFEFLDSAETEREVRNTFGAG